MLYPLFTISVLFCLSITALSMITTSGPFAPSSVALYSSPETVSCVAPAHTQGLVGVGLKVNGMTVKVEKNMASTSNDGNGGSSGMSVNSDIITTLPFSYLNSPIVQGIYPQMGMVAGGDTVMIIGQGFFSFTHTKQMVSTTLPIMKRHTINKT